MAIPLIKIRLASADILKAISIVAVVFIHAAFIFPFSTYTTEPIKHETNASAYGNYFSLSLRFCVPIFIILWAYFLEKSLNINKLGYNYLIKRFYLLLIPFFFWSIIYFLFIVNLQGLTLSSLITIHWSGYGWSGQYFFIILFQLIPIFILMRRFSDYIVKHFVILIILSIAFYTITAHYWWFGTEIASKIGDRPFIYWIPYVLIGIAWARRKSIKNSLSVPVFALLITASILLIPLESILSNYTQFTLFKMSDYTKPSVFIASIVPTYLLLGKATTYQQLQPWVAKGVGILARNTLGIFCLNPLIILLLSAIVRSTHAYIQFPGSFLITPFFSVALVISICIGAITLLRHLKLGLLVSS